MARPSSLSKLNKPKPLKLRKPYKNDESDIEVVSVAVMQGNLEALNENQRKVFDCTKQAYEIITDTPHKGEAIKKFCAIHPELTSRTAAKYIDAAIKMWNPSYKYDREFLETVMLNALIKEITNENANEDTRAKNLATLQRYVSSLPQETIDPTMMQKHDIYIQLNVNGSTVNIPSNKLSMLSEEAKQLASSLETEIDEYQAAEIIES